MDSNEDDASYRHYVVIGIVSAVVISLVVGIIFYRWMRGRGVCKRESLSVNGEEIHVKTPPKPTLGVPQDIKIITHNQYIDITWSPVVDAMYYELEWVRVEPEGDGSETEDSKERFDPKSVAHPAKIAPIKDTLLTLSGVEAGRYAIRLTAFNDSEKYDEPRVWTEWIQDKVATTETLLDISYEAIDSTTMRVMWKPIGTPQGFKIYVNYDEPARANASDFQVIEVADPAAISHVLHDLTQGYSWYVKVTQL